MVFQPFFYGALAVSGVSRRSLARTRPSHLLGLHGFSAGAAVLGVWGGGMLQYSLTLSA